MPTSLERRRWNRASGYWEDPVQVQSLRTDCVEQNEQNMSTPIIHKISQPDLTHRLD